MNQDAPINKSASTWYTGLFLQDDFRIHPRLILNLGLRYDLQTPHTDPHDRKLTYVAGAQSTVSPNALPGPAFPRRSRSEPRAGAYGQEQHQPPYRYGVGSEGRRPNVRSRRLRHFLRRSIGPGGRFVHEWPAISIRQQFNNVKSLTDPYGNLPGGLSPFPYVYDPANPRFTLPAGIAAPAWISNGPTRTR